MNAKKFQLKKVKKNPIINVPDLMEQYADHKTEELQFKLDNRTRKVNSLREQRKELQKEVERLKHKIDIDIDNSFFALQKENQQLKQENEELVDEILKVWNEDNGSVQPHTPIAWYRVLRIAERLTKINKDECT